MYLFSPGRNSLFENIKRAIYRFFNPNTIAGQQRSITQVARVNPRNWDLEIKEYPIRSPSEARAILKIENYVPETATALNILATDVIASIDGDDVGVTVSPELSDGTAIDPEVYEIVLKVCQEYFSSNFLSNTVERMVGRGDHFVSIGIDRVYQGSGYEIVKLLPLPTWEMFRLEDDKGSLLGFEQRRFVYSNGTMGEDRISFNPIQIAHFRFRQEWLYGRSLWLSSLTTDLPKLEKAIDALYEACMAIGYNPNVHVMPPEMEKIDFDAYKDSYEAKKQEGVITDLYMLNGGVIQKLQGQTDISALITQVELYRKRIIMPSMIPLWRFAGFEQSAAQDIAGQPALAYARFINGVRGQLVSGLKEIVDVQLVLKLGYDAFLARAKDKYRLIFPKISVSQYDGVSDESSDLGFEDLDSAIAWSKIPIQARR
jgi:hypothetical protein